MMIRGIFHAAFMVPVLLVGAPSLAARTSVEPQLVIDLSAHEVSVAVSYAGGHVVLFGATKAAGTIVVEVVGPMRREMVRRKVRTGGIWVDRDEMAFEKVPAFYAVASSMTPETAVPRVATNWQSVGGRDAWLLPLGKASPAKVNAFREALIRHKQRAGLYPTAPGKVHFLSDELFRTDFHFPTQASVGPYQVTVSLVKNGRVAQEVSAPLILSRVGFGAQIYELAHQDSLIYGLLGTAVAVLAGWLANAFFRSRA